MSNSFPKRKVCSGHIIQVFSLSKLGCDCGCLGGCQDGTMLIVTGLEFTVLVLRKWTVFLAMRLRVGEVSVEARGGMGRDGWKTRRWTR